MTSTRSKFRVYFQFWCLFLEHMVPLFREIVKGFFQKISQKRESIFLKNFDFPGGRGAALAGPVALLVTVIWIDHTNGTFWPFLPLFRGKKRDDKLWQFLGRSWYIFLSSTRWSNLRLNDKLSKAVKIWQAYQLRITVYNKAIFWKQSPSCQWGAQLMILL